MANSRQYDLMTENGRSKISRYNLRAEFTICSQPNLKHSIYQGSIALTLNKRRTSKATKIGFMYVASNIR